jgi:alpha-amylase
MLLGLSFLLLSICRSEENAGVYAGRSAAEWKTRIIYQVLTDRFARSDKQNASCNIRQYCGGTYKGIMNNLDYIQNLGMNAIWISPIVKNTEGSYHGYHATDFYALNTNFGTAAELKQFIAACKARDIWVMVDLVYNHVGPVGVDFSKISLFNKAEHYHDWCNVTDWNNQWQVENCRLADLPDLKQENNWVTDELIKWSNWIIKEYSMDGIRVDTVKHIPIDFWKKLVNQSGSIYMLGEVFDGGVSYLSRYTSVMKGQLSYPMYYTLLNVYGRKQSCYQIRNRFDEYARAGIDVTVLGGFIDNHDVKRWLNSNSDWRALQNAMLFNLYSNSIPLVYYGTEQGFHGGDDPYNREAMWHSGFNQNHELYKFIATAAHQKKRVDPSAAHVERYCDDIFYAFSRGNVLLATTSQGKGANFSRTVTYLPFVNGDRVKELYSGKTATIGSGGLTITISDGMPQIWVKA